MSTSTFYIAACVVICLPIRNGETLHSEKIMISSKSFYDLERKTQHHRVRRSTDFNEDEISAILDLHNQLRSGVSPEASNMKYMTWDDRLATMAQQWSEGCVWAHGQPENISPFDSIGQNLWSGSGSEPSGTKPTQSWYNEVTDYNYTTRACTDVCGHYTQVVWAKSYAVGCGRAFCPPSEDRTKYRNGWIVTCNYGPPGNDQGQSPYKVGRSCSMCDSGVGECYNNQCRLCSEYSEACACELECQHCGVLQSNCTCDCRDGWYGVDCSNYCEDTDPKCGSSPGWPGRRHCSSHATIPKKCPLMCGVCNSEDPNFVCDAQSEVEHGVTLLLIHDILKWSQIKLDFRRAIGEIITKTCNQREFFPQCCSTKSEKTNSERLPFVDISHVGVVSGYPRKVDSTSYSVMVFVRTPVDAALCTHGYQPSRRRREAVAVFLNPETVITAVSQNIDEIEQTLHVTVSDFYEGDHKTDIDSGGQPGDGGPDDNDGGPDDKDGGPNDKDGGTSGHSSAGVVILIIVVVVLIVIALIVLGVIYIKRSKNGNLYEVGSYSNTAEAAL